MQGHCRALSEEQAPDNPWRIAPGALFGRLDQFIARIGQLQAVFTAAAQFMRLDRVEIGSTKVQMPSMRDLLIWAASKQQTDAPSSYLCSHRQILCRTHTYLKRQSGFGAYAIQHVV